MCMAGSSKLAYGDKRCCIRFVRCLHIVCAATRYRASGDACHYARALLLQCVYCLQLALSPLVCALGLPTAPQGGCSISCAYNQLSRPALQQQTRCCQVPVCA